MPSVCLQLSALLRLQWPREMLNPDEEEEEKVENEKAEVSQYIN